MRPILLALAAALILRAQAQTYGEWVNPFVGTDGHGHTFPGACLPFGMVQLSPDTRIDGSWDGCSGYHYTDTLIYGFSHTHLSGTGVSDYGDMHFMPLTTQPDLSAPQYAQAFKHQNEQASPGWYQVKFNNGIEVQLTASLRCGIQQIHFPEGPQYLVINLHHRDKLLKGHLSLSDSNALHITRISTAWAKEQHLYAYTTFSYPFKATFNADSTKLSLQFNMPKGQALVIRTGISLVDEVGAKHNLHAEAHKGSFGFWKQKAAESWESELQKIQIETDSESDRRVFYTALYHCMIHPNLAQDVDGRYRGLDNKTHTATQHTHYTVFSLWDTFRAAHPLFTLIDQKRSLDFVNTFLKMYEQGKRLPVWELAANETDCMIGYHAVSVLADAITKNIGQFNYQLAIKAMKHSAELKHFGLNSYQQNKQIGIEDEHESVSKTLEYAYDDWCISQAMLFTHHAEYPIYQQRAQYWKNVFDPGSGFFRPKAAGAWLKPFDPYEVNNHYTEGNAWQYSLFVPHQLPDLAQMHGGYQALEAHLNKLFTTTTQTTGREQADITGLIGQYAHGNEPSHHMAWVYQHLRNSQKAQYYLNQILTQFYTPQPDGLIGNEDCGQMSAWYVLSALGLYQIAPGLPQFSLLAPHVSKARIQLENGKAIQISKSGSGIYPFGLTLNGQIQSSLPDLSYSVLMQGAQWHFQTTNLGHSNLLQNRPDTLTVPQPITINPIFEAEAEVFEKETYIGLSSPQKGFIIKYTTNGQSPLKHGKTYSKPLRIRKTTQIQAVAFNPTTKQGSAVVSASYTRLPQNLKATLISPSHPQYAATGAQTLIDGLNGAVEWRKGRWLGFYGQDFKTQLEFNTPQTILNIQISCLQDSRSWILMPTHLWAEASHDGEHFEPIGSIHIERDPLNENPYTEHFNLPILNTQKWKYLRVFAQNFGKLPPGHLSHGQNAYIFIDEIRINP